MIKQGVSLKKNSFAQIKINKRDILDENVINKLRVLLGEEFDTKQTVSGLHIAQCDSRFYCPNLLDSEYKKVIGVLEMYGDETFLATKKPTGNEKETIILKHISTTKKFQLKENKNNFFDYNPKAARAAEKAKTTVIDILKSYKSKVNQIKKSSVCTDENESFCSESYKWTNGNITIRRNQKEQLQEMHSISGGSLFQIKLRKDGSKITHEERLILV